MAPSCHDRRDRAAHGLLKRMQNLAVASPRRFVPDKKCAAAGKVRGAVHGAFGYVHGHTHPAMTDHIEHDPTEEEIRHEAYLIWLADGRPEGRDLDHWLAARELLRHRHARPPGRRRARARTSSVVVPVVSVAR
jgi:hypothetical protein